MTKPTGKKIDGLAVAAEMLNGLDPDHRAKLIASVAAKDPQVALKLQQRMFEFKDLAVYDGPGTQIILRQTPPAKLILALRNATPQLQDHFLKNLSSRAAQSLREDISRQGPQRLAAVQQAQQEMIDLARKLEAEGKIKRKDSVLRSS